MGGGSYDRDVYTSTTSTGGYAHSAAAAENVGSAQFHKELLPKDRYIRCAHRNAIVLELDGTGSNINAARTIYDKMPMFFGQLIQQDLLPDPSVSFAVNGDAGMGDAYPLQVCDFQEGVALDGELGKIYLEGNGGGNRKESYELPAWFYANRCELPEDNYSFYFLLADEGVYDTVDPHHLKEVIGEELNEKLSTQAVFAALKEKFGGNVFLIHLPYGTSSEDRPIVLQWIEILGADHVLCITDPKAMIDVILGTIAKASGKRTHEEYLADMADRGQTKTRIKQVSEAIKDVVPSEKPMPAFAEGTVEGDEVAEKGPKWV